MKPRKSFLLRVNAEVYSAIEAWARQEFRSVNGQIEFILREALRKHGQTVEDDGVETEQSTEQTRPDDEQ